MLGIPSSLVLFVKNRGGGGGGRGSLLNGQSLLSTIKVVCWQSLKEKFLGHYLKSKTNKNFNVLLGQITNTINTVKFLVCVISLFNNDLAIII